MLLSLVLLEHKQEILMCTPKSGWGPCRSWALFSLRENIPDYVERIDTVLIQQLQLCSSSLTGRKNLCVYENKYQKIKLFLEIWLPSPVLFQWLEGGVAMPTFTGTIPNPVTMIYLLLLFTIYCLWIWRYTLAKSGENGACQMTDFLSLVYQAKPSSSSVFENDWYAISFFLC